MGVTGVLIREDPGRQRARAPCAWLSGRMKVTSPLSGSQTEASFAFWPGVNP